MVISRSAPEPNDTLDADAVVASVPLVMGCTLPAAPGVRVSVPPPVESEPGLKTISLPLVNAKLLLEGCVITALTVITPLFASPILIVPAVMRSSSASVRPNVSGLPDRISAPPRLMNVPVVLGVSRTVLAPALIEVVVWKSIESPMSVTWEAPAVPIWPPPLTEMAELLVPLPLTPRIEIAPPLAVTCEPVLRTNTPKFELPVPAVLPPVPVTVTVAPAPVPAFVITPPFPTSTP